MKEIIQSIFIVSDEAVKDELLNKFSEIEKPTVISFINAQGYNLCYEDEKFKECISKADYLFRDGIGIKILFKKLSRNPGLNMNGTDFIPLIIDKLKSKKISLIGTDDITLTSAAANLKIKGIPIIFSLNGFLDKQEYITEIIKSKPDLIVLGMGMPKQEEISIYIKETIDFPCLIINGGAIIDFIGGKVNRAPKWMQNSGLEWLYRLINEPKRLFKRYVFGNLKFLIRTFKL